VRGVLDALRVWFRGVFSGKSLVLGHTSYARFSIGSEQDVLAAVRESAARRLNAYATLFIDPSVIDTVVFDVDAHDGGLQASAECLKRLLAVLRDYSYGGSIRTYFTGRGWHVYVDCFPTFLNSPQAAVSRLASAIAFRAGCKAVDVSTSVRAVRGFMRVVGSFNPKAGVYMVEVSEGESLDSVLGRARSGKVSAGHEVRRSQVLSDDLVALDGEQSVARAGTASFEPSLFRAMPPCIQSFMLELVATGELGHPERLQLALWLLRTVGTSGTELFFKEFARDYSPRVTSYQVWHLASRGYKFMSCRRIKAELGACPFSDQRVCVFYPWIDLVFSDGQEQGQAVSRR